MALPEVVSQEWLKARLRQQHARAERYSKAPEASPALAPQTAPILELVPESHAGRLFDHVGLHVADFEASKRFYAGALAPLGLGITGEGEGWFSVDELFVGEDGPATSGLHVAFQAQDREAVDRFYAAAIEAGGRDNGAPGERSYHPGYYGAYVLDPDGNNVEAVYHGPATRSAPSVVFSWDE
jgi:catechol 2,3-dioxygenase-like lactoylglutathione lyase family enzyme